jgi:matrix metalloproteinase-14 (membrane-inserted)
VEKVTKRSSAHSGIASGLKLGSSGPEVLQLQLDLVGLGFLRLLDPGAPATYQDVNTSLYATPAQFDKATVDAVRRLQRAEQISESGEIDAKTLEVLSIPRCGSSGIVIKRLVNPWGKNELTFGFANLDTSPDIDTFQEAAAAFQAGFDLWTQAPANIRFRSVPLGSDCDIVIKWGTPACAPYPHQACTQDPPYGDMVYHYQYLWSTAQPTPGNAIDIIAFACHEVGHALGLGHSPDPASIMYFQIANGKRRLSPQDKANIRAIYG